MADAGDARDTGSYQGPGGALGDLIDSLRRFSVESDVLVERFARMHGLGRTDLNAITWITYGDSDGAPLTVGQLAAHLGLGGPAATALVDRLEAVGHVVRTRDSRDRRRVTVSMQDSAYQLALEFFAPVGRFMASAAQGHTEAELASAAAIVGSMRDAVMAASGWHATQVDRRAAQPTAPVGPSAEPDVSPST